jgi:MFS transporter, ACS family, allantoate permease
MITMTPIVEHDSEKKASSMDENVGMEKSSINLKEGDEALRLIGVERTVEFSEEYNRKLRRKLVSSSRRLSVLYISKFQRTP